MVIDYHWPNCIFLIHTDVSDPFNIFSKYTPLKPLLVHATITHTKPTIFILLVMTIALLPVLSAGHYKKMDIYI